MASGLTQTLSSVDARELSQAVDGLINPVVEAALANGRIVRAVLRPLIKGIFKYLTGSVKNSRVFRRLRRPA